MTNIYYRFGDQGPRFGYQWGAGAGSPWTNARAAETRALGSLSGASIGDKSSVSGSSIAGNTLSGDTLGALLWESQAPMTKQFPPLWKAAHQTPSPVVTKWKLPALSDWPSQRPAGPEPLDPSGLGQSEGGIMETLGSPAVRTLSGAAMAYHGYKRTGSGLWAVLWAIFGSSAPLLAAPISVAQGFGKKKRRKNPSRKARAKARRRR